MISVLFLIPTLDRGGAENVLVDLVNHMDQSKFKVTVQTLFDENSQKDRLHEGIEYRSFLYHQFRGNSRLFARIPARLLYKMIVGKRYDIVVSYLEGPTTHIISGCPYKDSKKVAWVHVEMHNKRQLSAGFKSFKTAIDAYKSFDKVAFVAKTVEDAFFKVAGLYLTNTCVLYNTVDSEKIKSKSCDKGAIRLFNEDEFNIVSVGRIIPAKGFDRLANIQMRLHKSSYKTHVYILGEGNSRRDLEEQVNKKGIKETFSFLGFMDNPYFVIKNADLFVCSSRREGFSTAVTEALILGIPVISTKCSGASELLGEHNEYGIVTENDEQSLYEGIRYLLDNSKAVEHYRQQALIRGKEFILENTVKSVEQLLLDLIRKI